MHSSTTVFSNFISNNFESSLITIIIVIIIYNIGIVIYINRKREEEMTPT